METPNNNTTHDSGTTYFLSEEMLTEILTRLPLRSISRFKCVCKTWKSTFESVYFRRLFVSLHQSTSSTWSILHPQIELIDFHGCQTWGLPKSLGSYIQNIEIMDKFYSQTSSNNGLFWMHGSYNSGVSYVGNPVLQQWVEIPSSPYPRSLPLGLLTRVDGDGVVLSFKVVTMAASGPSPERSTCLCVCVYSSETGIWTCKRLHCPRYFSDLSLAINLNETLYFSPALDYDADLSIPGALVAHDFYGESNLCRVITLPDHNVNHNSDFKRAYTTSTGFVMYIKTFDHNILKIWRLLNNNDDDDSGWQLVWEIPLPFIRFDDDIRYYAPLAMHPFDGNIVYIWSQQNRYLVSCNLQTLNYKILKGDDQDQSMNDLQNCFVNQSVCEEQMDGLFGPYSDVEYVVPVINPHSLLPRWVESMPCPPQVEMMDTTSLLSYISSKPN